MGGVDLDPKRIDKIKLDLQIYQASVTIEIEIESQIISLLGVVMDIAWRKLMKSIEIEKLETNLENWIS